MSPEYDHLGATATLVARAIDHGKERVASLLLELATLKASLRLEIAALKGERDRLVGRNRELIKELDICRRRGDV